MNDSINNYLNVSKKNLNTILLNLENNIEFTENNLWEDNNEFFEMIQSITSIYFDNYYLYDSNDFEKINKYITFNSKINRKLKTILLAIVEYFVNNSQEKIFKEKEDSILYLTILIYLALLLYETNFKLIDTPKKIEKVINNILDNFQNIRFKREKDLDNLIDNIKEIIIKKNRYIEIVNSLNDNNIKTNYIKINDECNLYKALFEYNIKELEDYESIDIDIVNKKMNIEKEICNISYDLLFNTAFKLLRKGIDKTLLFPIKKDFIEDNKTRNYILNRNKLVNSRIKLLVDYDEIMNDYNFVNLIKEMDLNIYLEVNKIFETNNYNMFMNIQNVIVPEEFLSINKKYVEIWKDMKINFIIKDLKVRISEDTLINRK